MAGEGAVALAKRNVEHHDLGLRVDIREGDLLSPFDSQEFHGRVDLLSCNPPYISSTKVDSMNVEISSHEPRLAFDGGPFGIKILYRLNSEFLDEAQYQQVVDDEIARPVLIGNHDVIAENIDKLGLRIKEGFDVDIIDPQHNPAFAEYAAYYHELMGRKGVTPGGAQHIRMILKRGWVLKLFRHYSKEWI